MDNNKAVSAYFVKEYATDPTFTIEKVWENTNVPAATANGLQGVGWDQKIYIKDRLGAAINVYTETGSELYAQLGATVTGLAGDQPIAVDDAGNLVVRSGSTNFYDSPTQVSIFRKNENTPEVIDFTLPATGRCDFISASGDIFSEKGGYVYFFCMNQTTVSRLHIKNGEYEGVDTIAIVAEEGKAASQSHVVVDIYGNIHTSSKGKNAYEYNITTLTTTADSYLGAATKKTPKSTIGGCTFELGGKELWAYVAGTTNYSSEWELKNVTDGVLVSNDVLYAKDKTTVNSNPVANWLNVQVVDEKTAYIYQFCPTVAAAVWKVSFKENYIVSATATNGTVSGTGAYQEGASATLTATPNTGYKFVNWTKGGVEVSTDATYSFPVTENVELVANFEAITSKYPRAWAYDMKLGEEDDNYTFTFKATTAGQATISFKDKDGNVLAKPTSQTMEAEVGENKFTIAKNAFAAGVDAFWAITMDGAPIEGVVEVTDQSRGIYDFYNMMGVVVDDNTDSKDFGKIYVQASLNGKTDGRTDRADNQTAGIFIYNQNLDELNDPSNVGYKPTLPSGYTEIGSSYSAFQRLNIHPKTGNLVFSHAIAGKPSVFAINRDDMTGAVTNLLTGVADMTRSVAHCFDAEGKLYVMDFADSKGAVYEVVNGNATRITEISSKFINAQITMASDGRGGLWISQNRGQMDDAPYYYQLVHVNSAGEFDWAVNKETPHGFEGSSSRGALAYDAERNILAQGRNGKVELYTVTYEPTITLTPLYTIASDDLSNNIDGLAFDIAGDLYVVNSGKEKFQKFSLPTADNICTVAAPSSEAIRFTPVYTVSVESNNNEWGIVSGGGTFEKGQSTTITATAATNYKFINWTKGGAAVSTENPYTFSVTETATYTANFEEKTKYTIDVTYDNTMGTVTGAGSYYEGTDVTLTAKANGGYVFVDWSDGLTDESRTINELTANVILTANFKAASPRAWAYDLEKAEDSDNYTFTFTATSAGNATILFTDVDGNAVAPTSQDVGAVTAGETKTVSIAKGQFTGNKDIYWSVKMAGEAIAKMAEITNPARNIYDFYNMMGVVVDNDPNSDEFGKIYIQQSYNGASDGIADRSDTQTAGIFIYNQALEELNAPANTGIKPQLPYTIGGNRQNFKRITINPTNGHIAFCNNTTTNGGAYSVSREVLTGEAVNLTKHIAEIQKVNALCFDEEGNLYVVANVTGSGAIYKIEEDGNYTKLTLNDENLFVDQEIAMTTDGHGGLWIAQNRWGVAAGALFHVNVAQDKIDFRVEAGQDYSDWFSGANYRGAIAYDKQRDILAVHSQACASVFQVAYAADGVPSISKICQTPNLGKNELDGLAFDYAGDLYVVHSGTERFYKYVLPTNDNTCTVPAPKSQVIKKEARYTVTVEASPAEGGSVSGGGEYTAGETITLTATANSGYRFVNWTKDETILSTDASFTYTVPAENVTIVANFEALPEIVYELNGGVWNKYGWTSKKDMYNALLDDWRAYSGSTRTNVAYETQLGIGNSSKGIPITITSAEDRVALQELFADATYAPKWGWLATYVDAVATAQYKKMDAAQGVKTQPTSGAGVLTYTIGNFFGEDNAHAADYIDAVDFTGEEAHLTAFAPYWGQTFPMPTQPTEEVVLNAPYKEGYEFDGWYTTSDFSGAAVTTVDENTDGTLYAKWKETIITVTIGEDVDNTTNLAPYVDKKVTATVTRHFGANKILTVTLPFDMNATQIRNVFGNATVYEFYNVVDADVELHLQFTHTNSIEAGKPYILQTTTSGYDAEDGFTIENVTINTVPTQVKRGDLTMVPVLDGGGTLNQPTQYYLSNNALYCAGDYSQSLPGLRAFFTSATSTPIRARVIFDDNEATSIPTVIAPETKAQKIIKDGRLIIIRGEHQYNAQGQMIE